MLGEKYVLVIEDNTEVQHAIKLIFDFMGEQVVVLNFNQWKSQQQDLAQQAEDISVIVFGGTGTRSATEACHIEQEGLVVKSRFGATAIMTMGVDYEERLALLDDSIKRRVLTQLPYPFTYSQLVNALHRAQRFNQAYANASQAPSQRPVHLFRSLVGTSKEIQATRQVMAQVADTDVTVLIEGESGTGKEVMARNLHYHSPRRDGPFVPVNCGAIPAELLESELFGHEKGAFTGAISARAGRFEMAEGGTLFLDEIGDMPLHMQVKILRVLQEKTFERVGGNKTFTTNVRIIAATHRHLEGMIAEGGFREDLYYRLNVFPIVAPSLKERAEDVPLLINELVSRLESEQRGSVRFNSAAILSLCKYAWPGNVRELANLVERMAIMHPFGVVGVQDLPEKYRHQDSDVEDDIEMEIEHIAASPAVVSMSDRALLPEGGIDLKEYITGLEQNLIKQALDDSGGVVARAAERLTIRRTTLVEKMRKYGMSR
ncbi:sigma-54 dependent transcriptional regulator [Marinagarivorans algicola]|uniref:sigma-54 dependent transcriptional regulator n=1 Tax=Marinagarivorans algicola TaxID=1513270 RepID=UPI0006B8DAD5|nr:sigma-54 dependent transcriptional regulator [Marinagarivorans algicola]